MVVSQDILNLFYIGKATIDHEVQVREELLKAEYPWVLQWWNVSVLLWIEPLQMGLACMNDELFAATLCANNTNKVLDILPLIQIVNSEAALDRHWDAHLALHLCNDLSNQLCIFHKDCTKGSLLDFVGRTSAVDIDFIVTELLRHFGGLAHYDWIVAANLTNHRVLVWRK